MPHEPTNILHGTSVGCAQRGSCDFLYQGMLDSTVARVCLSMIWLSAAACGDTHGVSTDSELCARYKRVLLRVQRHEPRYASQPVDGSYDVYECPMDDTPELAECTTRLEQGCPESRPCDVPLGTLGCTRGLLIFARTDLRLPHDGIGEACSSGAATNDSGISTIDGTAQDCETQQCLSFQGGPPRCSCRCSTQLDEPTCVCPSEFTCRTDLTKGSKTVHEGYCLPAALPQP